MRCTVRSVLFVASFSGCDGAVVKGDTTTPEVDTSAVLDTDSDLDTQEDCVPTEEICDGLDNDCDEQVDEDLTLERYPDEDGDGFGDPARPTERCAEEPGWVEDATDCDDANAESFPGSTATEVPGDGVDADCDGEDRCADLDCDGLADLLLTGFKEVEDYDVSSTLYAQAGGWSALAALSAFGVEEAAVADLDGDGYQDVVLAQYFDGSTREIDSTIHWGGAGGYTDQSALPTVGAMDVIAQDLDGDGWQELVFANYRADSDWQVDSTVYWGSSRGYDVDRRTDLPTRGAREVLAQDLNLDGTPELVFCNLQEVGGSTATESSVYWGDASGYAAERVTELPTLGCRDVAADDLDGDGWADLVFVGFYDGEEESYDVDSLVYWGSADGYDPDDVLALPTPGALDVEVADVDGDGHTDLVFTGYAGGDGSEEGETRLFWGSSAGFSAGDVMSFSTPGAIDAVVSDLSGDGYPELVVARSLEGERYTIDSYVWYGSSAGWSDDARLALPTVGAYEIGVADANGDGHQDLCFSSYTGSSDTAAQAALFLGQPDDAHGTGWSEDARLLLDTVSSRSPPLWVPAH